MRENAHQNNSEYGHFFSSEYWYITTYQKELNLKMAQQAIIRYFVIIHHDFNILTHNSDRSTIFA